MPKFEARGWGAPWTMRQRMKGGAWTIETSTRTVVDGVQTHGEACIIMAAPEVLEALEELIAAWPADSLPPHTLAMKVANAVNRAKPK